MRIVWKVELETGVRSIDLQHEELIGMINELDDIQLADTGQALLNAVLQRLASYVTFHFSTEESLMASLPQAEIHVSQHHQQHRTFVKQLAAMRARAEAGESAGAVGELVEFLNTWLYDHILKTDRQLGALLNGQLAQSRASLRQG